MTERVEYTKRTAILGKTHVEQSFFAQKRADGTLCSARHPGLPTPFPYSKQSRNCDASSNFIDCNPQKGPPQKVPSARYCAFLAQYQKSKGRQPAYTHRRLLSVQQQSFYKGDVTPPPPQRDHVRTEGFLYWLQYNRVTLLLHINCHILTVQMS